jgi:hypothetical protein
MKQKLTLLLILLFSVTPFYSQIYCGYNDLLMPTNNDVAAKAAFDSARAEIRRKVADIRYNNNPNAKHSKIIMLFLLYFT